MAIIRKLPSTSSVLCACAGLVAGFVLGEDHGGRDHAIVAAISLGVVCFLACLKDPGNAGAPVGSAGDDAGC